MKTLLTLISIFTLSACDLLETESYKTDQEMLDFLLENELNFNALIEHKDYCNNNPLPAICNELMKNLGIEYYRYGNAVSEGVITVETIYLREFLEYYGLIATGGNSFEKGYIYSTSSFLEGESFGSYLITDQELERDSSHYGLSRFAKIVLETDNGTWLLYSEQLDD